MFYDNFVNLCNSISKAPSAVALEIGVQKSTVTRWKKGSIPTDATARKIADYFNISVADLMSEVESCVECEFTFSPWIREEVAAHEERHAKWEKSQKKFNIWSHKERELRYEYEQFEKDASNPLNERIDAAKKRIFAYFSRSVMHSEYNLSHITFEEYIPLFLHSQKHIFSPDVYKALAECYGSKPGMSGTRWNCNQSADDFDVSTDYPLRNTDQKNKPATQEGDELTDPLDIEFLTLLKQLTPEQRDLIHAQIRGIISSRPNK